jgi:hypothetical protein
LDEYCAAETIGEAVEELAYLLEIIHALANKHHGPLIEVEDLSARNNNLLIMTESLEGWQFTSLHYFIQI